MVTVNYTFPFPTIMKNLANGVDPQDAVTKSYVDALVVSAAGYSNANVANYLPVFSGNVGDGLGYIFGNGAFLTGITAGSDYSNANVAAYLPTYSGNVGDGTGYIFGNGSQLVGLPEAYSNANVAAYLGSGVSSDIIPAANLTYSLGNATNYWSNLWVANNTIYIGGVALGTNGNTLTVAGQDVLSNNSDASVTTTGNIAAQFFIGDGRYLANIDAGNISGTYGNANVAAYLPTYGGNIGNGSGYVFGNGSQLTGLPSSYGNANVAEYLPTYTGNLQGGNLLIYGNAIVQGNLEVQGTTTTINSNTLVITDKTITVANGAVTQSQANGAGIIAGANIATMLYLNSNDSWNFSPAIETAGNVTANYFFGNGALLTGVTSVNQANSIPLGTPADSDLAGNNVAISTFTPNTYVTDSVDDLNEGMLNIARGTFVGQLDFTANTTTGSSPLSVLFTATVVGNVNQWSWDFGDGNTSSMGPTVTHTYSNTSGGAFTVSVTGNNTGAIGTAGSTSTRTRTNYISIGSPLPIPAFSANRTSLDTGGNVQLSNSSQYATSFSLNWGDGNIENPGNTWSTAEHQYVAAANTDAIYNIVLTGTNQTAGPTPPYDVDSAPTPIKVYTPQSPVVTANTLVLLNGAAVSVRNDTPGAPGNTASFGAQQSYVYQWGDGTANSTVAVAAGTAGNPGAANLTHTYTLTSGQQTAGTVVNRTANLWLYTGFSTSPFQSPDLTISVEPLVTAGFVGQANVISDRTGDTALTGYVYTDYLGNDRALFNFQNQTSPTPPYAGNLFSWDWNDGSYTNTTSGGNVTHSWTSTGSKTVDLTADGNLGAISQSNTFTRSNYVTISANPTPPNDLSAYSLTMSTASQGTSPALAAGATDVTGGSAPAAGTSVTRYSTTATIDSSTVGNANSASGGTLTAYISGSATGQTTFTPTGNAVGTYTALVVSGDADAHTAISASTYPSYFYKVFDASVSRPLASLGVGYNTYQLSHSQTGNTTSPGFVKDNVTTAATLSNAATTVTQTSAGTLLYISGVPYYTTGATVSVNGVAVNNFIGQAYSNIATPLTLLSGVNSEGTSGSVIAAQTKTYAQIDGAVSMLTGGIPNANVGVSTSYTFGNLSVSVNGSVKAVASLGTFVTTLNGQSTTTYTPTQVQLYSGSITGINEAAIPVSASLGSVYTDDGVRITGFGAGANTPAFSGSTDYYTGNAWSGAVTVAGTQESIVRWGSARHYTTNLSTGYLPAGPDLNTGRSGTQYFTFAFRRATVANFDIIITGTVAGVWFAAPGTQIDTTSGLNGWLDCSQQYAGSGIPGSGTGGNGSDGSAVTGADLIPLNTAISNQRYTQTLGEENSSNATGNNILIRVALSSGQSISDIQIGVAA